MVELRVHGEDVEGEKKGYRADNWISVLRPLSMKPSTAYLLVLR